MEKIIIVGGGPAGLFCAYLLLKNNYAVDLYEGGTGVLKKFLVAGNGGLNLTHSEKLNLFCTRYGKDENLFKDLLQEFSPTDLRSFCHDLKVETFIGSSGRVFPKKLKAAEILFNWMGELKKSKDFTLYTKHKLIDLSLDKKLTFKNEDKEIHVKGEKVIFALGGGSWKKTGSDGLWVNIFENLQIKVNKLIPMNCGFEVNFSEHLKSKLDRSFLKNIEIKFQDKSLRSEIMLTPYGIEGSGIYALSNHIRDEILKNHEAIITLDLKPDLSISDILKKLEGRKDKESLSNTLRKKCGFSKVETTLLLEYLSKEELKDLEIISKKIKSLEIKLLKTRPIDEAISTSGGIVFSELDEYFQAKKIPGLFFAGEMLDFEAPTGGYLLQGCFSTAHRLVKGILLSS